MQDAEGDESLRKGHVARAADQHGAGGDQRDAAPERSRPRMRASREHQAHADQAHEQRHHDAAKPEPERVVVEIGVQDAEPGQVEHEVIDDHQAERESPQPVDGR